MLIKWHYKVLIDKCVFAGPSVSAGIVLSCATSALCRITQSAFKNPKQTQQECNCKTDFYGYFTSREDS